LKTPKSRKAEEAIKRGKKLIIKVLKDGKPLPNIKVEIHSKPMVGYTNDEGVVEFENVEEGDHTIKIIHENGEDEQPLAISGDKSQYDIVVNVSLQQKEEKPKNYLYYGIGVLLISLIVFIILKRKKRNG